MSDFEFYGDICSKKEERCAGNPVRDSLKCVSAAYREASNLYFFFQHATECE